MIDLALSARRTGSWTVLAVGGEIDQFTAPKLRDALLAQIGDGAANLVIDLSEVGFMDSSGLGVLVGALRRVNEGGGRIVLAGTQRPVERVLEITGLNRLFPMHPTVDDAVEYG